MPAKPKGQPHDHPPVTDDAAPRERAAALLQDAGLRRTVARSQVLETLLSATRPLSVQELQAALERLPIDLVTIYRTLTSLVERGVVGQVDLGERAVRYELLAGPHAKPHAHFVCRECGAVRCVPWTASPAQERLLHGGLGAGYVVERLSLLLHGLCPGCQPA